MLLLNAHQQQDKICRRASLRPQFTHCRTKTIRAGFGYISATAKRSFISQRFRNFNSGHAAKLVRAQTAIHSLIGSCRWRALQTDDQVSGFARHRRSNSRRLYQPPAISASANSRRCGQPLSDSGSRYQPAAWHRCHTSGVTSEPQLASVRHLGKRTPRVAHWVFLHKRTKSFTGIAIRGAGFHV